MTAPTPKSTDLYSPRAAWFEGMAACGSAQIKLSLISAKAETVSEDKITAAKQQIAAVSNFGSLPLLDAGFAILHEGEEGLWLLLHQWVEGGICTHHLWRSDLTGTAQFTPAAPRLMACVWELGIIDFERRAWMETAMAGLPVADYLTRTLPRGKL